MNVIGLDFIRISATDAQQDDFEYPASETDLSAPEYACYLSHRTVWENLVESDQPVACVLEDDAVLAPSLASILSSQNLTSITFDILRLETWPLFMWISRHPEFTIEDIDIRRSYYSGLGTAGYIITRDFAQFLLDQIDIPTLPIDSLLLRNNIAGKTPRIYQCDPAPCIQKVFFENLQHSGFGDSDIYAARTQNGTVPMANSFGQKIRSRSEKSFEKLTQRFRRVPYFFTRKTCRIDFDSRL